MIIIFSTSLNIYYMYRYTRVKHIRVNMVRLKLSTTLTLTKTTKWRLVQKWRKIQNMGAIISEGEEEVNSLSHFEYLYKLIQLYVYSNQISILSHIVKYRRFILEKVCRWVIFNHKSSVKNYNPVGKQNFN